MRSCSREEIEGTIAPKLPKRSKSFTIPAHNCRGAHRQHKELLADELASRISTI